ncbi:transcriptional regulator [Ornithinimicrobium panacihumi]|uniref:transcriptional regulator n=1 Tax=Ornithinimicrobium panacihumi TaxID=2008449 RepID=UPI003F8A8249
MTAQLDAVIHPTHRLRICAMLDAGTTVEMAVIKDVVGLSASALSKQVAALVDAGYVAQERARQDSRRIWLTLTPQGKTAYQSHIRALQEIVAGSAQP